MTPTPYVPDRGDIVWLQFNPQSGHEQAGYRPALVLSPVTYNERVGLMLCCPITSRIKGYPFEVEIKAGARIKGVVLADQVKSLDWKVRKARKEAKTTAGVIHKVLAKLHTLLSY
ncbi:MAG: endoribonuclease MazF [Deltaproteobacteria bacterium]|nr:endoribonuclease MazF [Deltaproteobacteria bacterium]